MRGRRTQGMLVGERGPEGGGPHPRGLLLAILFGLLLFVVGAAGIVTTVANAAAPASIKLAGSGTSNFQSSDAILDTPTPVCIQYTTATSAATMIPGVNNHVGNDCDDCSTLITLPFPVTVYGAVYDTANLGSNGHIQFASDYQGPYNRQCLPVSVSPAFGSTLSAYYYHVIGDQQTSE